MSVREMRSFFDAYASSLGDLALALELRQVRRRRKLCLGGHGVYSGCWPR